MDPDRTAELFSIVATYWHSQKDLAREPGLVAEAWRKGMKPDQILSFIRQHTTPDGNFTPPKLEDAVKVAQKLLRKKRKQGRVNRKRGRW